MSLRTGIVWGCNSGLQNHAPKRPPPPRPPPHHNSKPRMWTVPASGCTCDGSLATAESRGPAHAPAAVGTGACGTHTPNKPILSLHVASISAFEFEASALKRCFTPETDQNRRAKLSPRFGGRSAHTRTTLEVKTMLPRRLAPRPLRRSGKPADVFSKRELSRDATRGLQNDAPQEPLHVTTAPRLCRLLPWAMQVLLLRRLQPLSM